MLDAEDWFVRNFTHQEVACTCPRCMAISPKGVSRMAGHTMLKFQAARDALGVPLYGNSWCRCSWHNKQVGGKLNSSHVFNPDRLSCAGDVTLAKGRPMTSIERFLLIDALINAGGFVRIGINSWFIHADDDDSPDKAQGVMWLY